MKNIIAIICFIFFNLLIGLFFIFIRDDILSYYNRLLEGEPLPAYTNLFIHYYYWPLFYSISGLVILILPHLYPERFKQKGIILGILTILLLINMCLLFLSLFALIQPILIAENSFRIKV